MTTPASPALSPASSVTAHNGALTVKAYRGDGCVLFAMNLDPSACSGLAGFAIARSIDGGTTWTYAPNRLSFQLDKGVSAAPSKADNPANRDGSDIAPYQKFRWADFPPDSSGTMQYRVEARYFVPGKDPATDAGALAARFAVTFAMDLNGNSYPAFQLGFTRGYISSQAFDERYPGVKVLRPGRTVDYSTETPIPGTNPPVMWRDMYHWLGAHARQILNDFLARCETENSEYDVFAYDLDEPDFLKVLARDARNGRKIRVLLDNATLHTKPGALEILSAQLLSDAGVTVQRGHFKRYAHDKCVIQRDSTGAAIRVLTGSANFSVRGLYVQSNSIIAIDDAAVAALYGQAFDEAWTDMANFASSEIASGWFPIAEKTLPAFSVSFAPHTDGSVSLDKVAQAIAGAKSSVLFAVMELTGGGDVLQELTNLQQRKDIFSYGVTQTTTGVKFFKSSMPNGLLVPFAYLKGKVPPPFQAEWNGGMGQVIHHKFVVVDFNGANPIVFCGSSNLAQGGEESNGDNLLAITDPAIVSMYAVEAIKLVDHYEFRAMTFQATAQPILLKGPDAQPSWWQSSYDPANIKNTERVLFAT